MSKVKLTAEENEALAKKEAAEKKAAKKEANLQALFKKIDREWPIRCKLAVMAGHKAHEKNPECLMDTEFDLDIGGLYLQIQFRKPENAEAALKLIQEFYNGR